MGATGGMGQEAAVYSPGPAIYGGTDQIQRKNGYVRATARNAVQQIGLAERVVGMEMVMRSVTGVGPAHRDEWAVTGVVYAAAYRDLLRVAYVLTGSGPAAEDVVHDVFTRIGPKIATLKDPVPYLRVAVVNQCRSRHRRAARAAGHAARLGPVEVEASLDPGLTELRDALAALPVKQRNAVVLRYLCDLPDEEIASTLGCRRSTVRSLVKRGLSGLREVLT